VPTRLPEQAVSEDNRLPTCRAAEVGVHSHEPLVFLGYGPKDDHRDPQDLSQGFDETARLH